MFRRATIIIVAGLLLVAAAGCNQDQIADAQATLAGVREQIAEAEAQHQVLVDAIEAMPPGEDREAWASRADDLAQWIAQADDVAGDLERHLADATDGLDVAGGVIQSIAPFIPPPFNGLVIFVGGTVIGLIRAAQNRSAARRVVQSIEAAKDAGKVDFESVDVKNRLSVQQGATGKRIVDEAQGKASALLF